MNDGRWPALDFREWQDTYATLHMWTQVAGKVALALAEPLNHSWGIAMQVTPRGLATRTLRYKDRTLAIEFDFIDHQLRIRVSDGSSRTLPLGPMSVAVFYRTMMDLLNELGISVTVWRMPVEIPAPIRFDQDTVHATYVKEQANRAWEVLRRVERVMVETRCEFVGKGSPVHFFWGSFDLAVTRFSGRVAPPREGPAFMRDAYSHEVISHGFWFGNETLPEAVFYGYAVPEPAGFKEAPVTPAAAYYHQTLGEFVLPYNAVRDDADPAAAIHSFVRSTYDHGARLAGWDRVALERARTETTGM
jgi:hypothetical protein